jgi:hypothetical protein
MQCDTRPDNYSKDVAENADAATADGNVLQGQKKVYFLDLSKASSKQKWKERSIFLESDGSLFYNDKSLLRKRRFLLKLTALSSVDADPVVTSDTPEQFLLKVVEAETFDKKNSDVFFAFKDEKTRNTVQGRLQQAIIDIRGKYKIPNVCSAIVAGWRAKIAFMKCRVYCANECCFYYGTHLFCFCLG